MRDALLRRVVGGALTVPTRTTLVGAVAIAAAGIGTGCGGDHNAGGAPHQSSHSSRDPTASRGRIVSVRNEAPGPGGRTVVVRSSRRYIEGKWESGPHSGPLVLVSRTPPRQGESLFTLRMAGAPAGAVRVDLRETLPFEVAWSAHVPASGPRSGRRRSVLAVRSSRPTAGAIAAPVVHVSPSGGDGADGTTAQPLRTVDAALAKIPGGGTVLVAPGRYPPIRDITVHARPVTVMGEASRPRFSGIELYGAQNLRLVHLAVRGGVLISSHPVLKERQVAAHVQLRDSLITDPSTYARSQESACVQVRAGARDVALLNNVIQRCGAGIGGGGPVDVPSTHIQMRGNLLQDFSADAMQLGRWHRVVIDRNVIRHVRDPRRFVHNDAIQFVGGDQHVAITNNEIADSVGQLLFFQTTQPGPVGANSDVLVANNLIHGAGGFAIQSQGVTRARYLNNTVWDAHTGALLLRKSPLQQAAPHDTVVVNNILDGFGLYEGATARVLLGNITAKGTLSGPGMRLAVPRFINSRHDDFRLAPGSPGHGTAIRMYASPEGLLGEPRGSRPDLGAVG